MATTTLIPVEEYLATSYQPDCDYVDGEVQERNLGEQWHNLVQSAISSIFRQNRHEWKLRAIVEQRVQTFQTRYRVPDVCVVPSTDPIHKILHSAPMLCVEILSPEDRFQRVLERVQDYSQMGVSNVWIIDPLTRQIWTVQDGGGPLPHNGLELLLPGTPARLLVSDIFAEIDEAPLAAEE